MELPVSVVVPVLVKKVVALLELDWLVVVWKAVEVALEVVVSVWSPLMLSAARVLVSLLVAEVVALVVRDWLVVTSVVVDVLVAVAVVVAMPAMELPVSVLVCEEPAVVAA